MSLKPTGKPRQARKPRRPQISPTKIRTYLECPLKYKFVYVTRIGRFHYIPNVGDSLGGSLHRALQEFHASGGHETHSPEQLIERLQNTWVSVGYSSAKEEQEHLESGIQMLQDYYENSKIGAKTIFTEKQFKEDMGEFDLIGRIDRLDQHPDGTLEIVDYKSGRKTVTKEEVADDIAMSIYQLLVKKAYPGTRAIATIHCLRTGVTASAELSDEELVELEAMVMHVAGEMLRITEDTEIPTVRKPACNRCDFFDLCERRARNAGIEWPPRES